MLRVVTVMKMTWQVDEEVNWDKTGEAKEMNLEVDSKDKVMHIQMKNLWFSIKKRLAVEEGWQ